MAIEHTAYVWALSIPPEHKLLLLALCDNMDCEGRFSAWYEPVYRKTLIPPSKVAEITDDLLGLGILISDTSGEEPSLMMPLRERANVYGAWKTENSFPQQTLGKRLPACRDGRQYIYFLSDADSKLIKIGITKDPSRRIAELKRANPKARFLKCVQGTNVDEKWLHHELEPHQFDGEWFVDNEHVRRAMYDFCKGREE